MNIQSLRVLKDNACLLKKINEGNYECIFVSDDFARMMECSVEEAMALMSGRGFYKSTNPEDRPLVRSMLAHHMAYDGGSVLTIRKITARRNNIWCNVHYAFIDDEDGDFLYMTYSDVSTLKAHEDRIKTLYSNIGSAFYRESRRTLMMMRVNLTRDTFEEVRGADPYDSDSASYTYSEAMKRRLLHIPVKSEQRRFREEFLRENLIENYERRDKGTASLMFYTTRKDGTGCFVRMSAQITRHPITGDIFAFITEQKCNRDRVDEILTRKILAQQFDMVAYLSGEEYGVTIGDESYIPHGSIFPKKKKGNYEDYLNHRVYPVLTGTEDEKKETIRRLSIERIKEELAVRELYTVDISIEMGGQVYYKRFDFFSVDPAIEFYVLLKSDTTQIMREQLDRNMSLKAALEAAEAANVAKTAFLSSMSHEIRTPMNAIIGLNNIAMKDPGLSDVTRDHLEKIGESARHLLALINDILDMSRIESGRVTLEETEFSFASLIDQINVMISSQCDDKGLKYTCRMPDELEGYYFGDDMKLKQILINILGNAVKYTPAPGMVTLEVSLAARYEDQSTIRFVISDTGIGMDEDFIPRIFEAFSQEDEKKANKYGSTGLGMAITKNLVDIMNGRISVKSRRGSGSEFTVDITLRDCKSGEILPEEPVESGDTVELAGRRVLLAEDMPINAEIMIEVLGLEEILVEHAENGEIARDMFLAHPSGYYDAILMDLRMPVMDGIEATEAIRSSQHPDAGTIPIIALTANAFDEDVKQSLQAGMNAHLSKPVEPGLLFEKLSELIRS